MTPTTTADPPAVFPELAGTRRFTSDEYRRLVDADILSPDDKVELLDGYILLKMDHVDPPAADGPFPEWRWLRRFSTGEYHRMIGLGIIGEDEKLELLDGYLVLKMPENLPHRASVTRLMTRLAPRLPASWLVGTQFPISLGPMDPQPDGVILRGTDEDYDARVPLATDLGVIIEVADSSLQLDRRAKGRLYARFSIPVYWIVNVADKQIEVYTEPDPSAAPEVYRTRTDYRPGQDVPVVLDGVAVASVPAADLLP
ncbi:MAG TPA: Uma2 family endonuclease [Urbifossiella sp.]|nr:Uma2 family endonuclease [Urbifossiella sp.]